jgi:murein L,D-transpeptidase YafK
MRSIFLRIVLGVTLLFASSSSAVVFADQTARLSLPKADRVVVLKSERRLVLMRGDFVLKVFPIALGRYPKGHKQYQGDAKTPEGEYLLDFKLKNSQFYRAIRVNYPNARDRAKAQALGKDPGGKIMIHGLPNSMSAERVGHPYIDWTQGCIAVNNKQMDEIWQMVDAGTPIEIHP